MKNIAIHSHTRSSFHGSLSLMHISERTPWHSEPSNFPLLFLSRRRDRGDFNLLFNSECCEGLEFPFTCKTYIAISWTPDFTQVANNRVWVDHHLAVPRSGNSLHSAFNSRLCCHGAHCSWKRISLPSARQPRDFLDGRWLVMSHKIDSFSDKRRKLDLMSAMGGCISKDFSKNYHYLGKAILSWIDIPVIKGQRRKSWSL